ncbi:MAG TPA: hypothetical protein VFG73_08935 [Rhodanobacteraceae bacterium]|nr:hypothetical protein [Rhodanobacteraceae bacterium]
MKKPSLALATGLALACMGAAPLAAAGSGPDNNASDDNTINCKLDYTLTGWSVLYRTAHGSGTVTCDNGESMPVMLNATGGGLSVGAYKVNDGTGDFTGVKNINDVLGVYAVGTVHAGAVKSVHGSVMSKGGVTLVIGGTGDGWDIGVGFASFSISKAE